MNDPANSKSAAFDPKRELLRHTLATLAYRAEKAIHNAPAGLADFSGGKGLRTPVHILAHMGDLLDWAFSCSLGRQAWINSEPKPWNQEMERFFTSLKKFDDLLASNQPVQAPLDRLFQGPIADALTHIGQIAMLRHMAGEVLKAENYYIAEIETGRVGPDQAEPKFQF